MCLDPVRKFVKLKTFPRLFYTKSSPKNNHGCPRTFLSFHKQFVALVLLQEDPDVMSAPPDTWANLS